MIRYATLQDLNALVAIHNQAIADKFQTAFTEPNKPENRLGWFNEHVPDNYPMFVYEVDGVVAGYLSISDYRNGRGALRYAVEVSYFIDQNYRNRGIASALLNHGISACRSMHYKTILAIILEPNLASAHLLEKSGFEKWGYLPAIADFDGVECGQIYYGLKL